MDWAIPIYQIILSGVALALIVAFASGDARVIRCAVVLGISEAFLLALWMTDVFTGNVYVGLMTYTGALVAVFWPPAGSLQMIVSGIYLSICCNRLAFVFTDQALGAYAMMWQFEQALLMLIISAIIVNGVWNFEMVKRSIGHLSSRLVAMSRKGSGQ